jgi:adenylate kinase family enzyme
MKRVYCIIGLPLSGKSQFAKMLAKANRYGYISTGDIARRLMKDDEQAAATRKADLFPDEQALRDNLIVGIQCLPQEVVLVDGFPRSADQVKFMIDKMWHWFPEIIDINSGDDATLIHRARSRSRDVGDSNMHEFTVRLAAAKKNQAHIYRVMTAHSLQWKTILSGDDQTMITQFKKVTKND